MESSDTNLKNLMQPSTIRGNDSDTQIMADPYVKYDDNNSVMLDDYKQNGGMKSYFK